MFPLHGTVFPRSDAGCGDEAGRAQQQGRCPRIPSTCWLRLAGVTLRHSTWDTDQSCDQDLSE